ncbi:hypothetical protein BX666DRAFT_2026216 [Dichotomocladium elegans]|nr:hypothetical protein BX666DRAFT_2026216 [Dichotomocladium elegans]
MEISQRPEYRDAKTPRAVRVYTIAQESRYIVFENVPALGLVSDLLKQCATFGPVEDHRLLDRVPRPEFTETVWVKFYTWRAARLAKLTMDDKPFFHNLLRVSYAPEYESIDDARNKLQEHRHSVARRPRRHHHHQLPPATPKQVPLQPKTQSQPTASSGITVPAGEAAAATPILPHLGTQPKKRRRI